jgi:TPR repeat protein
MTRTAGVLLAASAALLFLQAGQSQEARGRTLEGEEDYRKGRDLHHGSGVAVDWKAAVGRLRPAAERGHPLACAHLAVCFDTGRGVGRDKAESRRYAARSLPGLRRLAAAGDAEAQFLLGRFYSGGLGVERDYKEALVWLRKAAGQKQAWAYNLLGYMHLHGEGVSPDPGEAYR